MLDLSVDATRGVFASRPQFMPQEDVGDPVFLQNLLDVFPVELRIELAVGALDRTSPTAVMSCIFKSSVNRSMEWFE